MDRARHIVALIGSYRRNGATELAVTELLAAAEACGAVTTRIHLGQRHLEFCTNCRICTNQSGPAPGTCPLDDEMAALLETIRQADALVLASPVNFGTVTALMKRFIERLVCVAHWPWGAPAPTVRPSTSRKPTVIITTSAAPAIMARYLTGTVRLLTKAARLLGGKRVGVLAIGFTALKEQPQLRERTKARARRLGRTLAS